jgi:hypothetical protein
LATCPGSTITEIGNSSDRNEAEERYFRTGVAADLLADDLDVPPTGFGRRW